MKKNKIEAPSVVHGSSDKSQGEYFRKVSDDTVRAFNRVGGKGSKPRTNINNPAWRDGYDEINWSTNKKENK